MFEEPFLYLVGVWPLIRDLLTFRCWKRDRSSCRWSCSRSWSAAKSWCWEITRWRGWTGCCTPGASKYPLPFHTPSHPHCPPQVTLSPPRLTSSLPIPSHSLPPELSVDITVSGQTAWSWRMRWDWGRRSRRPPSSPHSDRCFRSNGVILADEMGLGKTIQTTAFLSTLWSVFQVKQRDPGGRDGTGEDDPDDRLPLLTLIGVSGQTAWSWRMRWDWGRRSRRPPSSPHSDRCFRSNGVILADEMGLGKTIQTTAFLSSLWSVFQVKRRDPGGRDGTGEDDPDDRLPLHTLIGVSGQTAWSWRTRWDWGRRSRRPPSSPHSDRCFRSNGVILADEMGLGKTIQTTAFLSTLWSVFQVKRRDPGGRDGTGEDDPDDRVPLRPLLPPQPLRSVPARRAAVDDRDVAARVWALGAAHELRRLPRGHQQPQQGTLINWTFGHHLGLQHLLSILCTKT